MATIMYTSTYAPAFGTSPFEEAIDGLNPLAWYRFRDGNWGTEITDSSGNAYHLTKQLAAATRSGVPTRTTHPGGAYFPAVTYDNWATQGTFYKGTTGLLSGATQYTLLVSMRMVASASNDVQKIFAIGTENAGESGTNDLMLMVDRQSAGIPGIWTKHRTTTGGLISASTMVTETTKDGVNRLYMTRYQDNTIHRLTTTKPGYLELVEENADATSGTGLDALSKALILNARSTTTSGSSTTTGMVIDQIAVWASDIGATNATNLATLWQVEVADAGYYPSMMDFDGSTGYYSSTYTASGNKVTTVMRFNRASFSGGGFNYLCRFNGGAGNRIRSGLIVFSNDYATAGRQDKLNFLVQTSTGTNICSLYSTSDLCDGEDHVVFASFDGDAGTAVFRVDGVDEDDTGNAERVAPTTGTLGTGAGSTAKVGANDGPLRFFDGPLGYVGHSNTYLTNYSDFISGNLPLAIDESAWTEWGAQPLFWSHTGEMTNNKGSAGDMTKTGTITMTTGGSP